MESAVLHLELHVSVCMCVRMLLDMRRQALTDIDSEGESADARLREP